MNKVYKIIIVRREQIVEKVTLGFSERNWFRMKELTVILIPLRERDIFAQPQERSIIAIAGRLGDKINGERRPGQFKDKRLQSFVGIYIIFGREEGSFEIVAVFSGA